MAVFQGSLLDVEESIALGRLDGVLGRTQLADGAWIDLRRSWITGTVLLLDRLLECVPWKAERRVMYERVVDVPRLAAFYDEKGSFPDATLKTMLESLRAHYRFQSGGDFRTAGLCLYRDGRDSVAWHGDRIGRGQYEDVIVAIVSLGERRTFLLRPRGGGQSRRFVLESGDLLVMGGSCQRTWEHSVPKTARTIGPRISVQFRPAGAR